MPISYEVVQQGRVVVTTFQGHISGEELLAHGKAMNADARILPEHRELADLSHVDTTDVSSDELRALVGVEQSGDRAPGSRVAIIAQADLYFGLSRIYEAMADAFRSGVRVCRSRAEAKEWLGIEDMDI